MSCYIIKSIIYKMGDNITNIFDATAEYINMVNAPLIAPIPINNT